MGSIGHLMDGAKLANSRRFVLVERPSVDPCWAGSTKEFSNRRVFVFSPKLPNLWIFNILFPIFPYLVHAPTHKREFECMCSGSQRIVSRIIIMVKVSNKEILGKV